MAEEKRTETMVPQEDRKEAEAVMNFIKTLDSREKERFFDFLNGATVMKNLSAGAIKTA